MLPHHDHVNLRSIPKITYGVMQIAVESSQNHIFTSRQANKRPVFCLPSLIKNHKLILPDQQMWELSFKSA